MNGVLRGLSFVLSLNGCRQDRRSTLKLWKHLIWLRERCASAAGSVEPGAREFWQWSSNNLKKDHLNLKYEGTRDFHCRTGEALNPGGAGSRNPIRKAVYEDAETASSLGHVSEVLEELGILVERGSYVSTILFYRFLKEWIAMQDLAVGERLLSLILRSGYGCNVFLANDIIRIYASHGMLQEAKEVFLQVPAPDTFLWASIILAHAEHGQPVLAVQLYRQMRQSCLQPNSHVFVAVLKACATARDLESGKQVHADILVSGEEPNKFVGSSLVDMYAKCGSLEHARRVFESLTTKDAVSWNAMIAGYALQGLGQESLALYSSMQQVAADQATRGTFVAVLKACSSSGALHQGKELHSKIRERGMESDIMIGSCLVDMYAACGSLEDACRVFDRLPAKDVVAWTAMMAGYAQHRRGPEALSIYARMQQEGIKPVDPITFTSLLKACASIGALTEGKHLHSQIQCQGLELDMVVGSALVDMYAKCGSLNDALRVFEGLVTKDVVSWNAMIAAYAQHGMGQESLDLYASMQKHSTIRPNHVTYACLLKACGSTGALDQGKEIHAQIRKCGLELDTLVGNGLVYMYSKCGSLDEARHVFYCLPARDVVTWTCLIAGYTEHGLGNEALALYAKMQEAGIPPDPITYVCLLQACGNVRNVHHGMQLHSEVQGQGLEADQVVGNCLVDMYTSCGCLEGARAVFDRLSRRDVVTWTAMIAGYAELGHAQEALTLYAQMQEEGITPAEPTAYSLLLNACSYMGALHQGRQLHLEVQHRGWEVDGMIGNCLVDMYAKCGSLEDSCEVFDRLPWKDVVTWTAMIAAYAHHGCGQEAVQCFESMLLTGIKPDGVTFVAILSACRHSGLVDKGIKYFKSMSQDYSLTPELEHYASMVDLFGRAGSFQRAQELLSTMPMQPDLAMLLCLLGACRKHGNLALAEEAFQAAVHLEPNHAAAYFLMSHIYADAGLLDHVTEVHARRQMECAWKEPGQSWLLIGESVHSFVVGDCQHPQHPELCERLEILSRQLARNVSQIAKDPSFMNSGPGD